MEHIVRVMPGANKDVINTIVLADAYCVVLVTPDSRNIDPLLAKDSLIRTKWGFSIFDQGALAAYKRQEGDTCAVAEFVPGTASIIAQDWA